MSTTLENSLLSFVGRRLLAVRTSKMLSQRDFAARIGVSPGYMSELEHDKKSPGSEVLIALKREFDVDLNWLLTGDDHLAISQGYWSYVAEYMATMRPYDQEDTMAGYIQAYNSNLVAGFVPACILAARPKISAEYLLECLDSAPPREHEHLLRCHTSAEELREAGNVGMSSTPVGLQDWFNLAVQLAAEGLTPAEVLRRLKG